MFLAGFAAVIYPVVGNYWNMYRANRLINSYEENMQDVALVDTDELFSEADAYNAGQMGNRIPDAFAEGEQETDELYESLLNYNGDGIMGYLAIPCIDVSMPILHGTGEKALTQGAGHLIGSSLPVGGKNTHAVLAAHRGLPSSALFTDLNLVEEGDLFFIHVLGKVLAYETDKIEIVEPEETESLAIIPGEDRVTLVTCTPYGVNSHRLLVHGHRTEYSEKVYEEAVSETRSSITTNYVLVASMALLLVAFVALLMHLRNRRRNRASGAGAKPASRERDKKDEDN